ncbi:MAG: DUF4190 domain-containing protein [bacterium]|nr:DUF4190 domain-containing protein [bacterium]
MDTDQQPQQPQQPQQQPAPAPAPEPDKPMADNPTPAEGGAKTNTMAILSLVFAFFIPIVGLILAIIAMGKIKKTGEGGKGLTIAALIISILGILASIFFVFAIFLAADDIQQAADELEQNSIQFDDQFNSNLDSSTF